MARPIIITCAVTGGSAQAAHASPYVPVTPEDIANECLAAAEAGAASWTAFFGASDTPGSIMIDKPPAFAAGPASRPAWPPERCSRRRRWAP